MVYARASRMGPLQQSQLYNLGQVEVDAIGQVEVDTQRRGLRLVIFVTSSVRDWILLNYWPGRPISVNCYTCWIQLTSTAGARACAPRDRIHTKLKYEISNAERHTHSLFHTHTHHIQEEERGEGVLFNHFQEPPKEARA